MPKLEESLIDKLTPRPEVREKARALLRTVHSKTGPGTGHDIGEAKIGLPAICAYIASKRYARCFSTRFFFLPGVHRVNHVSAGYADVTEDVAQKASCLKPRTFASTLRTIKAVLLVPKTPAKSPSKSRTDVDPTAYAALIKEHKIGQPLRVESWMKEAHAALVALPRYQHKIAPHVAGSEADVRIAVFFWVSQTIKVRSADLGVPYSAYQHTPPALKHNSYAPSRKAWSIPQDLQSSRENAGGRMRRSEGLHQRHDKGDAQEESHRRYTVTNTNDNDTFTLAIRVADQVRPTHRKPDTLPRQQRKAQSRILALRHIRLGR